MCGGDMPWSRRVAGISTASQVGSLHNEAVRVAGEWVGAGQRRTLQRQADHYNPGNLVDDPLLSKLGPVLTL